MKKMTLLLAILFSLSTSFTACDKGNDSPEPETPGNNGNNSNNNGGGQTNVTKIKITIGEQVLTATLADNPTAKDFITLLPLTVKLDDYNSTEKIFYPERKLSTKDAPSSINPAAGDITYYSPWGNVAIFYKDFRQSSGLIRIAKFDDNISALQVSASIDNVRFEIIEPEN